jgi:Zn-finger nucleic acid-binding protein
MLCPVCKESMLILELDEIEIDFCTGCDGIWLDTGELELLFDTEAERNNLVDSLHEYPDHPEKQYRCPICSKKMVKVYVGDEKEIIIDKCKKDHGLWFDKGELKTVIEFGSNQENKIITLLKEMFENRISTNDKGENK